MCWCQRSGWEGGVAGDAAFFIAKIATAAIAQSAALLPPSRSTRSCSLLHFTYFTQHVTFAFAAVFSLTERWFSTCSVVVVGGVGWICASRHGPWGFGG